MEKITIIVPLYNSEKWIRRCVDSILEQTYKDFELILADDGSRDKSGEICDQYAANDLRIKVIHKENGGASSARNAGIGMASGKYIMFVDSDDYIEQNMLQKMVDSTDKDDDLIISSIALLYEDGVKRQEQRLPDGRYNTVDFIERYIRCEIPNTSIGGPWCKLYKTEIIKSNNIGFDISMRVGEDTDFNIKYLYYCKSIVTMSDIFYNYMHENASSLTRLFPDDRIKVMTKKYNSFSGLLKHLPCSDETQDMLLASHIGEIAAYLLKIGETADFTTFKKNAETLFDNSLYKDNILLLKNNRTLYTFSRFCVRKNYRFALILCKMRKTLKNTAEVV